MSSDRQSRETGRASGGLFRSTAVRVALAYGALFSFSALLLLGFIYWSTASFMLRQADETIEAEIEILAERYRSSGLAGLTALLNERLGPQPMGSSIYLLADANRRPLVGNLSGWPEGQPDAEGWIEFRLSSSDSGQIHRARTKPFRLRGGYLLLVGRDMYEITTIRRTILRTLIWGLALTMALAVVGGMALSRGRIRRIAVIDKVLGRVMEGDLSQRIPTEESSDDIEDLVGKLNRMLEELEQLFEGVRRVSDNIAHDLRTPLSRLKTSLERLLSNPDLQEQRPALESTLAEADRLLATFGALLRIARIEAGRRRSAFTSVDLSQVARDAAELYEPLFEESGRALALSQLDPIEIRGDRDLLFQALANLVDNALKHTPDGGRAEIFVRRVAGAIEMGVADNGPGIPPAERQRVKERFYRLDSSRTTPGAGLGLSLVEAVADLHKAAFVLEEAAPGLRVSLQFVGRGAS